jgi:large subunit ribosomal protein L9
MPEAILLNDVENLGERGTVVNVSAGYLRNYLLPRKLAARATKGALVEARERMRKAEEARRQAAQRATEYVELLTKTVLTIPAQAGKDGRLFGSVTAQDIAKAIRTARDLRLDKRKIKLEEPIRNVGTYMITVEVAPGMSAEVKTMIVESQ